MQCAAGLRTETDSLLFFFLSCFRFFPQDMIKRQELSLAQVKIFVLDEADEMLSRGFKDQARDTPHTGALTSAAYAVSCATGADLPPLLACLLFLDL